MLDALLQTCSTTAAGRQIGLSQPAVSAALGRLRHALGAPLVCQAGAAVGADRTRADPARPSAGSAGKYGKSPFRRRPHSTRRPQRMSFVSPAATSTPSS
ncbi:LysR family transcriptional regulator [Jhaorihella thermophila]